MDAKELQSKMTAALTAGDIKAIEEIASEIVKGKADRRKDEAAVQLKEAEAMAGDREKLAIGIHTKLKALGIDGALKELKAWGFIYKIDRANPAESDTVYKSVSLSTQAVRKASTGGNGGAGKTKDEFGLSLTEVYEKHANAEDKGKMLEAESKDKAASDKLGKQTNSNAWRVKNDVKKRAIADNLLAPTK